MTSLYTLVCQVSHFTTKTELSHRNVLTGHLIKADTLLSGQCNWDPSLRSDCGGISSFGRPPWKQMQSSHQENIVHVSSCTCRSWAKGVYRHGVNGTAGIVSYGTMWHFKRQCQNVVSLVAWVVISKSNCSLSIGSDRSPVVGWTVISMNSCFPCCKRRLYLGVNGTARIVSSGAVWHVKRQCQNVVSLVAWIVISQSNCSLGIGSDRPPVVGLTDGPLGHLLWQLLQHPHFLFLVPLSPVHDLCTASHLSRPCCAKLTSVGLHLHSLGIGSDRPPVVGLTNGPLGDLLWQLLQHPHFLLFIPLSPVYYLCAAA